MTTSFLNQLPDFAMQWQWLCLNETDSTNAVAKRFSEASELSRLFVVTAQSQTEGRGTQGRVWQSPEGGIYFSFVLPAPLFTLPLETPYTRLAGQATLQVLKETFDLDDKLTLKGVNDVMYGDKKLGGILTESVITNQQIQRLIVGIGINQRLLMRPLSDDRNMPVSLEEIVSEFFDWDIFEANQLISHIINRFLKLAV